MSSAVMAATLVFLAEIGDKTQLVALGLATRYRLGLVLAGVGLAYALTQGGAALLGGAIGTLLPRTALGITAALLFFAFAAWTFLEARSDDEEDDEDFEIRLKSQSAFRVVPGIVAAMALAEFGDKSMLTTATIAAEANPWAAWIGATIGICACGGIAILAGRAFGSKLSNQITSYVASSLFVLFGVLILVEIGR